MAPTLHVTYCGGWGYQPRFQMVKQALEAGIPGVTVIGEATRTTTGAFEIENRATGKTYHSKLNGDGFIDDRRRMDKLISKIAADK